VCEYTVTLSGKETLQSIDPKAEYASRLEVCRAKEAFFARRRRLIEWVRIRVFIPFAAVVALMVAEERYPVKIAAAALVTSLFAVLLNWHQRTIRCSLHAERARAYYEEGIIRLEDGWMGRGRAGSEFLPARHPYAIDLDLFGEGSLFERLCTARTGPGESTLASWLLAPASAEEIRARQVAVQELQPRTELREQIASLEPIAAGSADLHALAEWARTPPALTSRIVWLIAVLSPLTFVLAITGSLLQLVGSGAVMAALGVQIGYALLLRNRVRSVTAPIEGRARDLALLAGILDRLENDLFASEWLVCRKTQLTATGRSPSSRVRALARLLDGLELRKSVLAPVPSLFLWKTHFAFASDRWRRTDGQRLEQWIVLAGEFEAILSLATYAYENPPDPFPIIMDERTSLECQGLGHPLIPGVKCVRNDLRLGNDLRLLVVSGSNMSGKSTLLRAAGLNVVLAQAGAPVRATKCSLSPLAIGATLRILDSVQAGHSRFFAEIMRMRQIVELSSGPIPVLFLLDEILHGTNSFDRRTGAEAVVRSLLESGAIGLITTHDLTLAEIADVLAPQAANVHFEDEIVDGEIKFDYYMRPGVVQHSNALALMRSIGLKV
jgi:hypothetical protein